MVAARAMTWTLLFSLPAGRFMDMETVLAALNDGTA
jgi:hypothetical protein